VWESGSAQRCVGALFGDRWIGGAVLGRHFDGDITVELGVPRSIHLARAALAERFKDFVMTKGFADQDGRQVFGEEPTAL
jgi:hypothetical protein